MSGMAGAGAGGTGGDPGTTCNDLSSAYAAEFTNAKTCSTLARNACTIKISRSLACPTCTTFVNDDTQLKQIANRWQSAGCDKVNRICPAIACLAPSDATCKASSASATDGLCSDNNVGVVTQTQ